VAVYALMVGINAYHSPGVPDLGGCRTDIADAVAFLEQRRVTDLHVERLLDGAATRAAIVEGFRGHLARAKAGDTALFWFSGHGSTAPVPERFWHLEPGGTHLQTLVCADSRVEGRPDLLDKDLGRLLDEVAGSGCHVVAILDCCHAHGLTRGPGVSIRAVPPSPPSSSAQTLFKVYGRGRRTVRHVLLAACRAEELAGEAVLDGERRGRFTWALLQALRRAGPDTTYRDLVALARNEVERQTAKQHPSVFPPGRGLADQRVLGSGAIGSPPSITMRHGPDGWEVNAGSCHDIAPGTHFAVPGRRPPIEVRATTVDIGRSLVESLGPAPDPAAVYPMVVSRSPDPLPKVAILDPKLADRLRGHADLVPVERAELIVGEGGRLTDRDGTALWTLGGQPGAELAHIVRWRRIRHHTNPLSTLTGSVRLEVVEPYGDETTVPRLRPAATPSADGTHVLPYEAGIAPHRFLRLRNVSDAPLYCVLLDLTERFKSAAHLYPGGRIPPGAVTAAGEGRPIRFSIPRDVPLVPGASYRDWLMLIVSTEEIDPAPYELPSLDLVPKSALLRELEPETRTADWWTHVTPVVITVPLV
jgi:hypothetical protein